MVATEGKIIHVGNLLLSHIIRSPRFLNEFPVFRQFQKKVEEQSKNAKGCRCRNRANQAISKIFMEMQTVISNFSDGDKQRFKSLLGADKIIVHRVEGGKAVRIQF